MSYAIIEPPYWSYKFRNGPELYGREGMHPDDLLGVTKKVNDELAWLEEI